MYEPKPFPRMLYKQGGAQVIVNNEDEERAALDGGAVDHPDKLNPEPANAPTSTAPISATDQPIANAGPVPEPSGRPGAKTGGKVV